MTETQPETRRLGYARVSTYGQMLDAQLDQLRAEGCAKVGVVQKVPFPGTLEIDRTLMVRGFFVLGITPGPTHEQLWVETLGVT